MVIYKVIGLISLAAGAISGGGNRLLKVAIGSKELRASDPVILFWNAIVATTVSIDLRLMANHCNLEHNIIAIIFLEIRKILWLAVRVLQQAVSGIQKERQSRKINIQRFFSLSADLLCVIDFDGYFKQLNPAAEAILGYSPAEMLDRLSIDFVHPDDREAMLKEIASIAAGNSSVYFENRWRCRDGSYKWLAWTANPYPAGASIYAIARDITEIKNTQKSLQETCDLLYRAVESADDPIFAKDLHGRYLIVNSKTASVFNTEKSEIIGKTDLDLLPTEIANQFMENDRRIVANGVAETIEEILLEQGKVETYISRKNPLRDRSGKIIGVCGIARNISDRKIAEEQLWKQKEFLRSIYDGVNYMIFVVDIGADGEFRYAGWNPAVELISGISSEQICGKTPAEIFPEIVAGFFQERLRACVAAGRSTFHEETTLNYNGQETWLMTTLTPLRDESGKIYRIVGSSNDITERKQAEALVREQEEFLNSIYNGVSQVIFVVDVLSDGEFRYADWNAKAEIGTGISSSYIKGKTPEQVFPPEVAADFRQRYVECLEAGCCISYEDGANLNGRENWFVVTLTPLQDASGKIYRLIGNSTDITERKQAEAKLRAQEEFLNSIYNGVSQMIFVVDVCEGGEFRYAGWNAAAEASTGISSSDVKGKTPEEIFPPEVAADFRQRYVNCLSSGSSIDYENGAVFNGVESWFVVTITPLRDASGKIYRLIGNATDITQRKQAEAALQESQRFVQKIADASPNVLYVYDDIEQQNVYSNREIATVLGYSIEEIQAMGNNALPSIIHPDDLAEVPQYWQQLESAPDGEVIEWEYRIRNKQGDWRWLVSREIVFSRTESGKIKQRLGAATDVTERKIAEQALAEQLKFSVFTADVGIALTQNQTLQVILQKCCDAVVRHLDAAFARIWILNAEENVLELQASAGMYVHLNGVHSRVTVGHLKIGLIAKERIPYLTNEVLEDDRIGDKEWAAREGMVAFAGYPLIFDGQLVGVIAMFSRQKLNESTLIALASVADTIALGIKRKQTEEALARQQQTLRGIIDNAPIWVWMTHPSGRMLLVNKTFCEDVAIPESKFLAASHYSEVLGIEASTGCMASDVKAWSQNTPFYAEEVLQFADGKKHYLETIKTQIKDAAGNSIGLIGLGFDVTEQKEAQRKLQESEARFRQLAEREALLNCLASNIRQSLDFDTILATTVQQIREFMQLDRCLFIWYLPDAYPPSWNVTAEATNAELPSLLGLYPVELTGTHAERIANLKIISIDDVDTITDPGERDFLRSVGVKSALNIPIQTQSGKIGQIVCNTCSNVRVWRDEEVELLIAIGNQLAIAINQAELYEKSRFTAAEAKATAMQQKLLNQLASQIRDSLDIDTILATTVQQVRELLQLDRCVFIWYLPDLSPPAWNVVHESKSYNLSSQLGYYPIGVTEILPQKIANLEIYRVDNVEEISSLREREFFLKCGYKSILNLPVKSAGGITGIIACISVREVRRWTSDEIDLLVAIGDQVGIAIDQAELYTQSVDSARMAREQAAQLEDALCELQQAQTQLVQAEKMSSLGQMVAGIAHEINNPVSFIFGNLTYTEEYTGHIMKLLQMYREEFPEPSLAIQKEIDVLDLDFLLDDLPKMLSSMQVGATRIRDIVRSLRTFSRLDESDMKKVDICEGIDSTLMILEHRLKAGFDRPDIQVVKEYGKLPPVECYAGQLNQVFMNIIANAIDALDEAEKTSLSIRIRTEVENDFAVIRIADSGTGMTNEVKRRIFDPFFTTKPIGSGTGLGLAISHSIVVEKHKGKLLCISAPGKGTEFIIKIPIFCQNKLASS